MAKALTVTHTLICGTARRQAYNGAWVPLPLGRWGGSCRCARRGRGSPQGHTRAGAPRADAVYQVQMANAWVQRIEKEANCANFWWDKYRHTVTGEAKPQHTGPNPERARINSAMEVVLPSNTIPNPQMEEQRTQHILAQLEAEVAAERERGVAMQATISRLKEAAAVKR